MGLVLGNAALTVSLMLMNGLTCCFCCVRGGYGGADRPGAGQRCTDDACR
jgi:hypothetical protein